MSCGTRMESAPLSNPSTSAPTVGSTDPSSRNSLVYGASTPDPAGGSTAVQLSPCTASAGTHRSWAHSFGVVDAPGAARTHMDTLMLYEFALLESGTGSGRMRPQPSRAADPVGA